MVARQLARLAGEANRPIGDQDLGLADPAGIEQHLAGRRVAGRILVTDPEIELAERNPACLTAPAHMDDALAIGQKALEPGTCPRRRSALELRGKFKSAGLDP